MVINMEGLWLSIALVCFLLELMTLNFYTICAAIGAILAWAMVRSGLPVWVSAATFAMITAAMVLLLRPALKEWLLGDKSGYDKRYYDGRNDR